MLLKPKQNKTKQNKTQHNTTQHNTTQHNTTQHNKKQNKTKNILDVLAGFLSFKCCKNYCKIFEDKYQLGRAKSCKKKKDASISNGGVNFSLDGGPQRKKEKQTNCFSKANQS